jgi:hypothetical protein
MSVRILDETGAEIVSFFSDRPSGDDWAGDNAKRLSE